MAPAATAPAASPPPPSSSAPASFPQAFPSGGPAAPPLAQAQQAAFAKDAVLAWYRGEFAAANAIIDALCDHLAALDGAECCGDGGAGCGDDPHGAAFEAIARRRANWIPVLHMQKFFSVADVAEELRRVAEARKGEVAAAAAAAAASSYRGGVGPKVKIEEEEEEEAEVKAEEQEIVGAEDDVVAAKCEKVVVAAKWEKMPQQHQHEEEAEDLHPVVSGEPDENPPPHEEDQAYQEQQLLPARSDSPAADDDGRSSSSDHSSNTKLSDNSCATTGSASPSPVLSDDQPGGPPADADSPRICFDHAACVARIEAVRACKRFVAKESVKGHMVNVVKGLKLYEDVFLGPELCAVAGCIDHLRAAGRRGELTGETFIFFNKQLKGNKREVLQLGVPVFQSASEEAAAQIDPIPPLLQDVIDHLVEWRLVPEGRKPNSCVINFFEEDEHSQPYFKPPHLDNPISTLLLQDTTMAFGRSLVSSHNGNYRGSLTLPLRQGSLLVMRGNSADMARHVVCPTPNARVSITFLRVRPPLPPSTSSSPTAAAQQQQQQHQQQKQHHNAMMALWKPQGPTPMALPYGAPAQCIPTTWAAVAGMAPPPPPPPQPPTLLMLAPPPPVDPRRAAAAVAHFGAGTGVFLPWTVGPGSKKYVKHLPPRIQRRRLLSLPANMEIQTPDKASAQIPCIVV